MSPGGNAGVKSIYIGYHHIEGILGGLVGFGTGNAVVVENQFFGRIFIGNFMKLFKELKFCGT